MTITDRAAVHSALEITNTPDDVFDLAWEAADAWVADRVSYDTSQDPPPALVEAVVLMTNRLLARRNSPAGVLSFGEFGPATLPGTDADVRALIAPYRTVVFG